MTLLGFLLPTAVVYLALCRFRPDDSSGIGAIVFRLCLAAPIGLGLSSIMFFLWAVLFTPDGRAMVIVETVLLAAVGLWLWFTRAKPDHPKRTACSETGSAMVFVGSGIRWIWSGVSAVIALAVFQFFNVLLRTPHGHWDAWAIWNLHARILFRGAENWLNAFSPLLYWSSPDYPPGLPGAVANLWKFSGGEIVLVPMAVAAVFFVATAAILVLTVRDVKGSGHAAMAGLFLAGTPLFLHHSASQYADVPLGFFCLAAAACLARYDSDSAPRSGWLAMAGLCASLAAWTKNEGMLFIVALVVARVVTAAFRKGGRPVLSELWQIGRGAAPVLAVLAFFKIVYAPPSGLLSRQSASELLAKLIDLSRYREIAESFFSQVAWFGQGMTIAMVVILVLVGTNWKTLRHSRTINLGTILAVMMAGYFFAYVITPENLTWHLSTSVARLMLQLWPTAILAFCLVVEASSPRSDPGAARIVRS